MSSNQIYEQGSEVLMPLEKIQRLVLKGREHVEQEWLNFYWKFLVKNQPCLVTSVQEMIDWPAMKDWVYSNGDINFGFLLEKYGNVEVSVTQITKDMAMEYGGINSSAMLFKDYVQYWIKYRESGYSTSMPCLYLKDWHILTNCGEVTEKPYKTLKFFSSDWLNETSQDDDFQFAYMGPAGSWTPLHADVYGSFSWSVNIIGQKKWHLYPPGKERRFITQSKHILYNPDNRGIEDQDFIEVIQDAGEIIFVPSGWYHVVWNESDVISINHNWFNASNICYIWHQLQHALDLVKVEIEEFKDSAEFAEQCQLILKANHGMNYNDFCELILKIWKSRSSRDADNNDKKSSFTFQQCSLLDMTVLQHVIEDHLLADMDVVLGWKQRLRKEVLDQK